ncbi:MAG: bifunctional acetaldehyde-CoA/alcohol dehydrogenase [Acholeplasmatales bacterium]|jgi:acetaldehyde dehydrogenase/alcohol dehydrogenase|nr:bifunctional acetaldehyde-CoA/alcohol dehydrogenase [Acholeplasmatales bacterium]
MVVNNLETLNILINKVREAQKIFALYTQEQVDHIFQAVAIEANNQRIPLAALAYEETHMGVLEDKIMKNHFACENVYHAYKDTKTCGVFYNDEASGYQSIYEPVGVIGAIIPTTNPTSTTIFKILMALKTRNAIIISAHPKAKNSTNETAKILLKAAIKAGAPHDIIGYIDQGSLELTNELMKKSDLILATGGPAMVKAAYSSGTPAVGVGPGNVPALIDESADIPLAVNSIIHSKTFDNGMICASEQAVITLDSRYEEVKKEFSERGCYFLNPEEIESLRKVIIINGGLNAAIVGQSASFIAALANIKLPEEVKILLGEVQKTSPDEEFSHEKLSPILAFYRCANFEQGTKLAQELVNHGGLGHSASIYLDEKKYPARLNYYTQALKTCRIIVNSPCAFGGIGDVYNFKLAPSLTLGCGSWGGNSVSENVGVKHLLNIKTVAIRRQNMQWLKLPAKIYFQANAIDEALNELKTQLHKKRVFVVTDNFLYTSGFSKIVTNKLDELKIEHTTFFEVPNDPGLSCVEKGASLMQSFQPDAIIAFGGGSAMDAAKICWLLYEHPEVNFSQLSMRFTDIRKRIYSIEKMGNKAYFIAIPTSAGTGSEVTPFAVITDEKSSIKYPIADYELMPNMAIIDPNVHLSAPKSLTAASGIDALTHCLEAWVSMMASDYSDAYVIQSLKTIFTFLPIAWDDGSNFIAREKMANAATMAGIAFANAFLGLCHSMAHKLGSHHHLAHGIANALLITHVLRFNARAIPNKMGTFSRYDHPQTLERYAQLADLLGLQGHSLSDKFESLILAIEKLKTQIDIKATIRDYGIKETAFLASLEAMVEEAFDDQCTATNPRYPLLKEIKQIYLDAYYGLPEKK